MTGNRAVTYQGPMKVQVENIDYPTFELRDGPGVIGVHSRSWLSGIMRHAEKRGRGVRSTPEKVAPGFQPGDLACD